MPWWSWVLIWAGLVLALLAVVALLGYRIVIKTFRAIDALGDLADKTAILHEHAEEIAEESHRPAVLDDRAVWLQVRLTQKTAAAIRRQIRRDKAVKRGKLLVTADPQQFSYLSKRT